MNTEKRYVATSIGIVALTIAAIVLSGCAQYTAGKSAALDLGASVNDEGVQLSIDGLCRGYSVGSIERRFMRSAEDWENWQQLCRPGREVLPLPE